MKHILPLSLGCTVALFVACQAESGGVMTSAGTRLPSDEPLVVASQSYFTIEDSFLANAFPPMLPDTEAHLGAWLRDDCITCHEDGSENAPVVNHSGMSPLLKQSSCRSCHLPADPDAGPLTDMRGQPVAEFSFNAFPPLMPMDESHQDSWMREDCMVCHLDGFRDAPVVRHLGMSRNLLKSKCRTCHLPAGDANEL